MTAPTFIDVFHDSLEPEFCSSVIDRFEKDEKLHFQGTVGKGVVDLDVKVCTELAISWNKSWYDVDKIIYESVGSTLQKLTEKYPGLKFDEVEDEGYRVKRYLPNGVDRFDPHVDQGGAHNSHRQLVFIWYLNDVEEGGETYFPYHDIKIKPERGKLVTFPPFWTHLHQGLKPVSGPKYTIGGWMNFIKPPTRDRKPIIINHE